PRPDRHGRRRRRRNAVEQQLEGPRRRKADIPYSLFFAPLEVVEAQLGRTTSILLEGVRKEAFSINSRSKVRLSDVELIVKDLLRKQDLIKRLDDSLVDNKVVGCIRRSRGVVQDADTLRAALGFSVAEIKAATKKEDAFELLIERFEAQQVLVARSQQNYMPQRLRERAKFSGMCVRDKKVPYIFLTNGDEGDNHEPAGRRVFTLTLLGVFVARAKFAPVTYDDHTDGLITDYEYQVTEEVLMPATEVRALDASTLDAVHASADTYRATPSAFVMRAQRLGLIDRDQARAFMEELAADFASRERSRGWPATPINAHHAIQRRRVLPTYGRAARPRQHLGDRLLPDHRPEQAEGHPDPGVWLCQLGSGPL
ncbi:MAG: hypothetical protein ACK4V6_18080, partial [Microthrixaceae bacterium]